MPTPMIVRDSDEKRGIELNVVLRPPKKVHWVVIQGRPSSLCTVDLRGKLFFFLLLNISAVPLLKLLMHQLNQIHIRVVHGSPTWSQLGFQLGSRL